MPDARHPQLFIIAWAFIVKPECRHEFERAYGAHGDWVRLFNTADGYIKTELHRDPENPARYITLDFWISRSQYESFREQAKSQYSEIDAKCERFTEDEQLLGEFSDLSMLHSALPGLGPSTQVQPSLTIRPAQIKDISAILRLEQSASSAAHWPKSAYEAIFHQDAPPRIALVAEDSEHKLSGFLVARVAEDECELENIVVAKSRSRQGIGSTLVQELCGAARSRGVRRIFLEMRESNVPARRLYEKCRFTLDGQRAAYYSDPVEPAMLYSLQL